MRNSLSIHPLSMRLSSRAALACVLSAVFVALAACDADCPSGTYLRDGHCLRRNSDAVEGAAGTDADGKAGGTAGSMAGSNAAAGAGGKTTTDQAADSGSGGGGTSGSAAGGGSGGTTATAGGGSGSGAGAGGAAGADAAGSGGSGTATGNASTDNVAGMSGGSAPCVVRDETCDNTDEDCDGRTDEALEKECGSSMRGACKLGKQTCAAGSWGECVGAVEPKEEVCDAARTDENCDGAPNEGCECTPGAKMECGSDVGACKQGTQTCTSEGKMGTACEGEVTPKKELCDAAREDENCDGQSNEGCACVAGQMMECGSDVGACMKGVKVCSQDGKIPAGCPGEVAPKTEVCDGRDDEDCDGRADDVDCECINGRTKDCTASGIGVCAMGKTTCVNGKWSTKCEPVRTGCECDDAAAPRACPGGTDVGECKAGTQRCVNGKWGSCEGARVKDATEKCDGVDGDCDGRPDAEDASCASGEKCNGTRCEREAPVEGTGAENYARCSVDADCLVKDAICSNASDPYFCSPRVGAGPCPKVAGYETGVFFQTGCVILCRSVNNAPRCPASMKCIPNPFMEAASPEFCVPGGAVGGL